jgi:hypothetical protein
MHRDCRGNEVTAASAATIAGIDDFVGGLLAYETRAANILASADSDETSALANAYAAMLWLFLESPDGPVKAAPYLARAETGASHATARERMTVAAVRAWADNDCGRAIAIGEQMAVDFPATSPSRKSRNTMPSTSATRPACCGSQAEFFRPTRTCPTPTASPPSPTSNATCWKTPNAPHSPPSACNAKNPGRTTRSPTSC